MPIVGVARLQFNIELTPHEAMSTFADARNAIIPFLWIEEVSRILELHCLHQFITLFVLFPSQIAALDDETRGQLGLLDSIRGGFVYARFGLILMGLLVMAAGAFLVYKGKKTSSTIVKPLDKNQNKR